jgi:hypothetical protein
MKCEYTFAVCTFRNTPRANQYQVSYAVDRLLCVTILLDMLLHVHRCFLRIAIFHVCVHLAA